MKKSLGPQTLVYPTPVFIVGSYDEQGRPNLMTASWGGIVSSAPPAVGVSIRPSRLTYANIMATRAFTINLPSAEFARQADATGLCSGRDHDKFALTGLTAVKADTVNAPAVAEFPIVLECKLLQTVEVGVHTHFIGEVLEAKVEESVLDETGHIDVGRLRPICFGPDERGYYQIGEFLGQAFSIGRIS